MVDDELADEKSTNVETWDFIEGVLMEACEKTSNRFSCEELKDDDM